jgi:hypothetical protein
MRRLHSGLFALNLGTNRQRENRVELRGSELFGSPSTKTFFCFFFYFLITISTVNSKLIVSFAEYALAMKVLFPLSKMIPRN